MLPFFAVIAVLVKTTSRGPLFFKQTRCGMHSRPFTLFKFRSMVDGADLLKRDLESRNEATGPVFKIKADPRLTKVGRFLRRTSLDELPQLFNILRGEMSLVGPRPPVPDEVAKYEPWQRRRLSVMPGLTCTWQVSGRSQIAFEQWMRMDLDYISDWSLSKDFSLLLKTVPAVLSMRGAA
jgi:lipopolysaccharide/colanic/teichoic acid biosynthesis glycosyltransferase